MKNLYYGEKNSICQECFNPIDKSIIEHFCSSSRATSETTSTAESDYASNFKYAVNKDYPITIYLSGPMSDIIDYNRTEFIKYADKYRNLGFKVISPIEIDTQFNQEDTYENYLRRDIRALLNDEITRMYLLPGWQKSKGANLEVHLAKMFKIPIYDTQTDMLFEESVAQEAQRIVMGSRGKDYGHPLDDFGRTAGMMNAAFRHKLNEKLTEEDVALIMILVKLSRLINSPDHRDSGVDIVGYDLTYWMVREERDRRKEMHELLLSSDSW